MKNTEKSGHADSSSGVNSANSKLNQNQGSSYDTFSLHKVFDKNGLFILCAVLFIITVVLFNKYIFFGRLLLFSDWGTDSINFDWPQRYFYSKYLRTEGIPTWSFAQGLGANVFPGSLGDAGNWLLYMVPLAKLPYALAYVEMFKLFLSGVFIYLFLKKINISPFAAIVGGALFAFSGFMTIGTVLAYFATEGCYLAFLLYSFELLRKDNNYLWFPVAIALAASNNALILYMHCLLLAAYMLSSFVLDGFTKSWVRVIGKMILLGALGLGLAAFFMLGNIYLMLQSPRGSGSVSLAHTLAAHPMWKLEYKDFYITFLLRMFGNDMSGYAIGTVDGYQGPYQYLLGPCQYCGIISLVVLPQLFVLGSRKLKWIAAAVITVAVLPVVFSYFRYAFWLFSGDYFRTFSLVFSITQIVLAIKALDLIIRKNRVNTVVLVITWAALTVLVIMLSRYSLSTAAVFLRKPVIMFLLVEAILVWLITKPTYQKPAFVALLATVLAELIFSNWGTYNYRINKSTEWLESRTGYNDSTIEAVKFLHATDHSFFRLEKNYGSGYGGVYKKISWDVPRSYNDAQMQDYFSSPSYFSFNNKYYVRFLQKMQFITDTTDEKQTRWIDGVGQYPLMQMLVSSKYLLLKEPHLPVDTTIFDSIAQMGDVRLFKNRFTLPLGFTYSACISGAEFGKTGNRKQMMLFKAAVVDELTLHGILNDFKQLTISDTAGTDSAGVIAALYAKLKADTMQISSFTQSHITGKINVHDTKLIFFSIPYDKGWSPKIDGKPVEPIIMNYGFWGCLLSPGQHEVELTYTPPFYNLGFTISALSVFIFIVLAVIRYKNKYKAIATMPE